jgi:hypothetical protein
LGSLWKGKLLGFRLVKILRRSEVTVNLTRSLKKMQASEFFPLLYYSKKKLDAPSPCECIVHLFFFFFSLTIKDKTNILHLRQGGFTRKVRTVFTLKIIVSIFVKLFLILVLHLRQFAIVRIFVKRAIGLCYTNLD